MATFARTPAAKIARELLSREKSPGDGRVRGCADAGCVAMLEKTQEFFQICDLEGKGFITRRDMQRLHGELPLSAEELEDVFGSLDADGNGYLTFEEFSSGFSEFLFGRRISVVGEQRSPEALYQNQWEERLAGDEEEDEERNFCLLMESLGAGGIFKDPSEVRDLWAQLRRDEPHLLANFEEFLARVTLQIKEANQEKREMESALKRRAATHDDELQRLYEEMELQIKNEKDRILLQDSERFLTRSQGLEQQLSSKEQELEQLFQRQKRLERQCQDLHCEQQETRVENVKLKQTNDELGRELEHTSQELALAQEQLSVLQEQSSRLQEEREMEMYRVTEGLQRERESLLKQLDLLREMNKHLRDERDMCYQNPNNSVKKASWNQKSGSIALKYMDRKQSLKCEGEVEFSKLCKRKTSVSLNGLGPSHSQDSDEGVLSYSLQLHRVISIEEDPLPRMFQNGSKTSLHQWSREEDEEEENEEVHTDLVMSDIHSPVAPVSVVHNRDAPSSPRGQPVGKETLQHEEAASSAPDRFFKIVLVGNSSVGKTSVLRRFCDDCYHPGTAATVGIDYSVKTLTVDNSQVALQMWDTAGQERYRSITKQFFRKADGVVIMYDITAHQTFVAVRHWLASVKEGAADCIPIMLLGNKTDKESNREVQVGVGEKLAKDSQLSVFGECSAFSGHNVTESMVQLARMLKDQEDQDKEKIIGLVEGPSKKRSSCC